MKQKVEGFAPLLMEHVQPAKLGRGGLRRLVTNVLSILTSDAFNRATTFIIYILVARFLGAFEFGQMSLALTLFYTFQVLTAAGLKTLVIREVAKDRAATDQYLINGSIVITLFFVVSIVILCIFLALLNYTSNTDAVILLLSLGLLPCALSTICEATFQAWERMNYIAYANIPISIIRVSLAFLLVAHGYGVYSLVSLFVGCYIAILVIEWWLILQHITRPRTNVDPHFCFTLMRTASTFLGIDVIIAVWGSLQMILLSKLEGETAVGLYSAATQLMVPITLVFQSIALSAFPIMCRRFTPGFQGLKQIAELLIELLLTIALPTAIGLFFLADSALLLLYKDTNFLQAVTPMRILVWGIICGALTSALGQVLLAGLKEKVTLRIVTINLFVSLILGLILIRQFSLMGAAIASLLTGTINVIQHYLPVSRLLAGVKLNRLLWKQVVAAACMAGYLFLAQDQALVLTIIYAGTLYAAVLTTLAVWSSGGMHQLKVRYFNLESE